MTIQVTSKNINTKQIFKGNRDENFGGLRDSGSYDNHVSFKKYNIPPKTDKNLERKVFATTLLGVSTALAIIMKRKGLSLNPSKIFSVPFKEIPKRWGILSVTEYRELSIVSLATGSILGGLAGGLAFDKKENRHAKFREAVIQMVGNILTPVAFVSSGSHLYKHLEPSIKPKIPTIKGSGKLIHYMNIGLKSVPAFAIVGAFLAGGIVTGNTVGNAINNKCFCVEEKRKVKLSDFSAHIDDVCLAASLVAKSGGPFGFLSKIVPAALMVAGVSTGVAKHKDVENNKTKDSYHENSNKKN